MRFLFVGGCERSGTTLVQRVLCSHSRVAGGPDLVFTGKIAGLFDRMRGDYPEEYAARLARHYDEEELRLAFQRLLGGFLEKHAERCPAALYVSEKTPSNIFAARSLLELFPDARFVHVVRDGRDVLASHRDVARHLRARQRPAGRQFGPRAVCGRWNRAVDVHFELTGRTDLAGRYQPVRYEELVAEPQRVVGELFAFLGLEAEERTLTPESVPAADSGTVIDGIWVTGEMAERGFDGRRVGRWRGDLAPAWRLLAGLLMAINLRRLGYPVSPALLPPARLLDRLRRR